MDAQALWRACQWHALPRPAAGNDRPQLFTEGHVMCRTQPLGHPLVPLLCCVPLAVSLHTPPLQTHTRTMDMLFVRGDVIILVSPPLRTA